MFDRCGKFLFARVCLLTMLAISCWFVSASHAQASAEPGKIQTIQLTIKLHTGGGLTGAVLDHADAGLVLLADGIPYALAWEELDGGSAFRARRKLLAQERGGVDKFSAADQFALGQFALRCNRPSAARSCFARARKLDGRYQAKIDRALGEFRETKERQRLRAAPLIDDANGGGDKPGDPADDDNGESSTAQHEPAPFVTLQDRIEADQGFRHDPQTNGGAGQTGERAQQAEQARRAAIRKVYLDFGAKVIEVMGSDVHLIETDHFLIWTDFAGIDRDLIADAAEQMYAAMCKQFDLDSAEDVFLAKCPVFAWRTKARFIKFARLFDGHDGRNAVGYTRSIEKNGHTHMVLLLGGRENHDLRRFVWTLVHEGTHAFVHRVGPSRLIPNWINEGLAEVISERVLGDRCPAGERAALLARQYVRFDWPIENFLQRTGPIAVHECPLAASLVDTLMSLGRGRESFAGLIRSLKEGRDIPYALARHYNGMSLKDLESAWRARVRAGMAAKIP